MTNGIEKGIPGQHFEDFLEKYGTYEDTTEQAAKRVLVFQLSEEIKNKVYRTQKWRRVSCTSRSQLERLFEPNNNGVTVGV